MNLSIDIHHVNDGVVRLAVAGEVDLATYDRLRTAIRTVLTDARTAELVVDLNRVSFLDSTGIHTLTEGRRLAADNGINYLVTNPQGMVHRVLALCGVLPILTGRGPVAAAGIDRTRDPIS